MWWEMHKEFYIDEVASDINKNSIETCCPVCKAYLGQRWVDCAFQERCKECKATFTWGPKESVPTAALDVPKAKGCGCEGCKSRDGKSKKK